jgi:RHS repeat-associated protein
MITYTPMTTTRVNKGHYYYGAGYYDPKVSVWLSVDRLAAKYPSSSPYVFSGNNPIMLIDPNGDSLKATQEGWDYTLLGLKVMGIDNLFSYNSSTGMISFDDKADLSSYDSEQLETIEMYAIPAGSSTKNASIRVEDGNTVLPEINGSLDNRPNGPSDGVTVPTRTTRTPRYGPGRIGQGKILQGYDYHIMEQAIILRRNPRNALGSPFSPLKGLSAIHEIAHVRFSMTNGNESFNNTRAHNTRVEDFMRGVRSHYNKNGVGVARKPIDHK